jgi:hypothetical protein
MNDEVVRLTYIAWQSWCIESPRTRILIDPLLVDHIGRGPQSARVNFMFATPRQFEFGSLGPVDAVFLSHEHEDHFNIASLARLDRRIPVIASGLMSEAGTNILRDMGFRVDRVWSGDVRLLGDLELLFFGPDHIANGDTDEWDTTAYVVRQTQGIGVFASNVDIALGAALHAVLDHERLIQRQPVLFANMMVRPWEARESSPQSVDKDFHRAAKRPTHDANADLVTFRNGEPFAPFPGEVLLLRNGFVDTIEPRATFLASMPGKAETLPFSNPEGELKEPIGGFRTFDASRQRQLENELRAFAEYLYGGSIFRFLMSIGNDAKEQTRTFIMLFVVDEQGTEWAYEYRPLACEFIRVDRSSSQVEDYLAATLMWANDFFLVASGEIEPRVLERSMVENRAHPRMPKLSWHLWRFYHPLRFPDRVLAQYRRNLASERGAPICVFPRAGGPTIGAATRTSAATASRGFFRGDDN